MKRNRGFRRFAAVFLALFCMAATSTVAFAGGGDGEPYYTGEETTGGYEPQPLTPEGNMILLDGVVEGFNQASAPPAWNWNPAAILHTDSADDTKECAGRGSRNG